MTKKRLFAPLASGLGAMRRAATVLLVMLLTTATAWAQDAITGLTYNTAGGYYEINDAQDLVDLATYVNSGNNASGKTFKQTQDIDMSSAGNFEPIGSQPNSYYPTPFNGTYDGQGHAIIGLTVNTSSPMAGLFGDMEGGSVRNLTMVNPNVTSNYNNSNGFKYAGGIVGAIEPGTIENCNVINPTLNPGRATKGAICGIIANIGATVTNCYYYTTTNYRAVGQNAVELAYSASRTYTLTLADGITTSTAPAFTYGGTGYYASGTTITLPAAPIGWVYYTVNGSAIDGNTFDISADASVTVNKHISSLLGYDEDPLVDGSAEHPYIISTAEGWNLLCDCLNDNTTWNRFIGKTVKLGDDIGSAENPVTRMAGSDNHDFCGTFDGDEHTITLDGNSANGCYALFRNAVGATIRDLHVTGTITTAGKYAAGFISGMWGNVTIENCRSSVIIRSSVSGDGTHSGFVAVNNSGTLDITGCTFDGKLLTTGTTATSHCGGFVGWNAGTLTITNSLYAPADLADGETEVIDGTSNPSATFARNGATLTNCYYTRALGTAQGKQARTITAGDNVTVGLCGTATEYDVSGITAYAKGILYNNAFYAGSGDEVSLSLSNTATGAPQGYQYGYTASAGTLAADGILTMPDQDVTISVNTAALRSTGQPVTVAYINADGTAQEAQAVALDGTETDLDAGWYFVGNDISYNATITLGGDVHLILCDRCTMKVGTDESRISGCGINGSISSNEFDLNIYGQLFGSGALSVYTTGSNFNHAVFVRNMTINGGNVTANTNDTKASALYAMSNLTINGGTITATSTGWSNGNGIDCENSLTINGGIVTADGKWYGIVGYGVVNINGGVVTANGGRNGINGYGVVTINGGNVTANGEISGIIASAEDGTALTLGWTKPTDRITASSISTPGGGTVAVADGQTLTDGSGNIYTGTLTDDEISAIAGKTLQPCISYLDSDGETKLCTDFTLLTGKETEIATAGWYVATGTLNYTGALVFWNDGGDIHLILTDGCQMNFGTSESGLNACGIECRGTLTIYGQSKGDDMGNLSVYITGDCKYGIGARNALTINGGHITANTDGFSTDALRGFDGDIIINGGNVEATTTGELADAIHAYKDFNYNGGNVTATVADRKAEAISAYGGYTFSWSNPDDRIAIGSKRLYVEDGITATFSKAFIDGTNCYSGTLTGSEINVLAGKTLQPAYAVTYHLNGGTNADSNPAFFTPGNDEITLDEPTRKGFTFGGWYTNEGLTGDAVTTIAAGSTEAKTFWAKWLVPYLDENGEMQYCADYTVLTGDETKITAAGWYVATGTLNYTGKLTFQNRGDFHLILADGCQMNFGTNESRINGMGINCSCPSLTIYGQSTGDDMGNLSVYTTGDYKHGIDGSNALTINGGHIIANTDGFGADALLSTSGDITINGGNVEATATGVWAKAIYAEETFNYNGGNVTANATNGEAIYAKGGYNFSWSDLDDRITIGSTGLYIKDGATTATFNKLFTDGEGNYYSGTLTGDEINVLAGKTLQPCTAVTLADTDSDLDKKLTALDGATLDVTLAARTIDTEWNTIALPFDVSAEQLTETFGEGVKLYKLSGSTLDNGVLGLEFASATSIEAGKPYFIKASADVVNPTFTGVTIKASANSPSGTNYVDFIPTLGVTKVEGESLWEVLVLGAGNTLYNPAELPAMMKGFRGYFRVHDAPVEAMQYRMTFDEESDVTGIVTTQVMSDELGNKSCGIIYNLMGQKVNRAEKGLFIVNGKRVIIK